MRAFSSVTLAEKFSEAGPGISGEPPLRGNGEISHKSRQKGILLKSIVSGSQQSNRIKDTLEIVSDS